MTLGSTVSAARTGAGFSLDDVAEATRVRRTVLEMIEADDYSLCGGDFYARGHLRSIGHALGVDPEPWIEQFDQEHAYASAPSPAELIEHDEVREPRKAPNWAAAMAVVLAGVVGVGVWNVVGSAGTAGTDEEQSPIVAADLAEPSQPSAAAPAPPTVDPTGDAVAAAQGVSLDLAAESGRSWVSVSDATGANLFEGILEQGQARSFADDDEISIVLGNGAAIDLTVNGRDLGAPGASGEVVRLSFGPGDPTAG